MHLLHDDSVGVPTDLMHHKPPGMQWLKTTPTHSAHTLSVLLVLPHSGSVGLICRLVPSVLAGALRSSKEGLAGDLSMWASLGLLIERWPGCRAITRKGREWGQRGKERKENREKLDPFYNLALAVTPYLFCHILCAVRQGLSRSPPPTLRMRAQAPPLPPSP